MKNVHSLFGSYEGTWCAKPMALGLVLSCLSAFGEDRFLHETAASFWETNLVATVIGYSGQRTFMGAVIPAMGPTDHYPRDVWLYSIAPTNFAHVTFTIHSCGPWSLLSVYPTNQLFVFPASVCAKEISISNRFENDPIIPHQTVEGYCPYRTSEKWFPVTDGQLDDWKKYLTECIDSSHRQITKWQQKLENVRDEKKRIGITNRLEQEERNIRDIERRIEACQRQPQFFRDRIEWLKTQGVNPEPQKAAE